MAKGVTITRIFDASPELVWKAWTDSEMAKQWFSPTGFTSPINEIDLRVGGKHLVCMRSDDGKVEVWSTGAYKEIEPMKKLVVTDSFADKEGNVVDPSHYGFSDDFPKELLVTVTFEEVGGKTKVTLNHVGNDTMSDKDLADMNQGWSQTLDKLATVVK